MADPWKFFIVEISYNVPVEQLSDVVGDHRAFLQTGYDQGWLLLSGPQSPRVGGMVVARAPSQQDLENFFKNDPYQQKGLASYRFVEFEPMKRQPFLEDWITRGIGEALFRADRVM